MLINFLITGTIIRIITKILKGELNICRQINENTSLVMSMVVFFDDCTVVLIDKTDDRDHTRREEYWEKVLKTVSPYRFNTVT